MWGAGAVGGTIGGFLTRAGHDVTFVDRVREHVDAIRDPARGLHITGPIADLTVTAGASTPESVRGTWKHVFLAVKAHQTEEACTALAPHLADDGHVVSLQNGLCERVIAGIVGPQRTIGAFVNFGADWIAPGEILYSNRGAVVVGEIDGAITARLRGLHALLQTFDPDATASEHVWSYLWGKLGYGSLLFAQAVGQLGIADCLARPELLPLWRELAGEAVRVAVAEGTEPRGFNGFDPHAFYPDGTEERARQSVAAMVSFNRPNAKTHSGVWRDLAIHRRRTEVDEQVGAVVQIGRRHGIACNKSAALVRMIHQIENGQRLQSDNNLSELLHA
jgi:2-dehydropantoate 2-reductase